MVDDRVRGAAVALCARIARLGWKGRCGFASVLGALSALSLPPVYAVPILVPCFVGLTWLIDAAGTWRGAFAIGWCFGFGFFAAGLYWITEAFLVDAARFGWMAPFALCFGAGVLALETALALALCRRLWRPGFMRIVVLASFWTIAEMFRGTLFAGFPWNPMGSVWTVRAAPLQAASVIGVFGLSWLTVLAAAAPACLADPGTGKRARSVGFAALAILIPLCLFGYGAIRLPEPGPDPGLASLRIVQPDIEQAAKWNPALRRGHVAKQIRMSLEGPDPDLPSVLGDKGLILWAETSVPFGLPLRGDILRALGAATPKGAKMIVGAPRPVPGPAKPRPVYNAAFVLSDHGDVEAVYDKHHLVPFGEYLPLRPLLALLGLEKLARGLGDFSAGSGPRTLAIKGRPSVSILICYEIIFSDRVIDPQNRPGWILNMTNDAWFGSSAGPYQHFAQAKLRAVEQGIPVVRVANGGISAVVDSYGRERARLALGSSGVIDQALPAAIPPPFYSRFGTEIPLCLIISTLASFIFLYRNKGKNDYI